ncbi:MAG: DNA primase [Saccharofermentanales bacterium]
MSSETELIKERIDLAELVGEYVTLKQAGHHHKGLCPFHHEKTPSFIVSPERGTWHCFGCNESGDAFTFIQKIEGLDFPATLRMLAERAGVEIKQQDRGRVDRRTRLYDALSLAARFYHEILMRQPAGKQAKEYLAERGVREETMETFMVGYALHNWDSLNRYLQRKGFSPDEMIEAGLVGRSERGKLYDRFRGRIMFPVYDVQGRVVAFGGRITPWHATGEEGKYVNSPETEIYEKRRIVYNLHRAKHSLRHRETCLVVEGYMDVVMLVQSGINNVVATSGTAFTAEHIQQLKRYTDTLHFAFDSDAAGLHAAQAATQSALLAGLRVATVLFPAGEDPADVARRDPAEVRQCIEQPTPLVEVLLRRLKEMSDAKSRETAFQEILPFIRIVSNIVQQGEMIQSLAEIYHVPETVIIKRLTALPVLTLGDNNAAGSATAGLESGMRIVSDHYFLGLLIAIPAVRSELLVQAEEQLFLDDRSVDLYKQLRHLATSQPRFLTMTADEVLSVLPPDYVAFAEGVRRIAEEQLSYAGATSEQEGRALLRSLKQRWLERELRELQQQLTSQGESSRESLERFQKLAEQLAVLKASAS